MTYKRPLTRSITGRKGPPLDSHSYLQASKKHPRLVRTFIQLMRGSSTEFVDIAGQWTHPRPTPGSTGFLQGKPLTDDEISDIDLEEDYFVDWHIVTARPGIRYTMLFDSDKKLFGAYVARPATPKFSQAMQGLLEASLLLEGDEDPKRGLQNVFHMMAQGPGMGSAPQGQSGKCASWNAAFYKDAEKAIAFLDHEAVKNVHSYCVNVLSRTFPHIFTSLLSESQSSVWEGSFPWQPFSGIAINGLSSTTATNPHRDISDLTGGLCLVLVFGDFDAESGEGALRLGDGVNVEIRARPGDLMIFPSGVLPHWNRPMKSGRQRGSLALFLHASCIRWSGLSERMKKSCSADEVRAFEENVYQQWWQQWDVLSGQALEIRQEREAYAQRTLVKNAEASPQSTPVANARPLIAPRTGVRQPLPAKPETTMEPHPQLRQQTSRASFAPSASTESEHQPPAAPPVAVEKPFPVHLSTIRQPCLGSSGPFAYPSQPALPPPGTIGQLPFPPSHPMVSPSPPPHPWTLGQPFFLPSMPTACVYYCPPPPPPTHPSPPTTRQSFLSTSTPVAYERQPVPSPPVRKGRARQPCAALPDVNARHKKRGPEKAVRRPRSSLQTSTL